MGNENGVFQDTREKSTKELLKLALFTGKSFHVREGVQKVTSEFTKESMKSKKDSKHGVSGQSELVSILIEYLTEEFKLKQSDAVELPSQEVLQADLSYPKTPMMHALDFGHTELANAIKAEIAKASKKKLHVTSDEDGVPGFDRSQVRSSYEQSGGHKIFLATPVTNSSPSLIHPCSWRSRG
mmetsp:Transcript_25157/g.52239  ORF Transcript_25157/g.52239 Transcript_25157/m.52239 type:complete len:183 (-) Transcript_25157:169-717(-)